MPAPQTLGQLNTDEWQQLQDLADRFHDAWRGGGPVEMDPFLPPAGTPLRALALRELITMDLEMLWRHGQPQTLDQYLTRYPELGAAESLPVGLIFQEYHIRQRYGDRPPLASYQERFPGQFAELSRMAQHETQLPGAEATPPTPPPEPARKEQDGVIVMGGYKLRKRIGSAAFGEVWSADAPGGVPVAVKILFRPVDAEEARRELSALELVRDLRHPALVQLHMFSSSQDRLYVVMELAEGSLRDRLLACREEGLRGIPQDELLSYFRDAAEALDFLHANHVLHRDVKPENILLVQGRAKVADFGLAREQGSKLLSTATGAGTPLYMAPEVFRGQMSARSDQYGLAMAYAELRLDRRLMRGVNMVELMLEHLHEVPDLSGLPEAEQRVLLKALAKDPTERYPSCVAWIEALEKAAGVEPRRSLAVVSMGPEPAPSEPTGTLTELTPIARRAAAAARPNGPRGWRDARDRTAGLQKAVAPRSAARRGPGAVLLLVLLLAGGLVVAGAYEFRHLRFKKGEPQVVVVDTGKTPPGPAPSGGGPATEPAKAPPPGDKPPTRPGPAPTAREPEEPRVPPSLVVEPLAPLVLGTGEKKTFPVTIQRNFRDPVRVKVAGLPPGVSTAVTDPGPGANTVPVEFAVAPDARPGSNLADIQVDGAGLTKHGSVEVTVVSLPPGFEPVKRDEVVADRAGRGKRYFRRIRRRFGDKLAATFVLVPKDRDTDPETFYVLEDKATVGLFRKFIEKTGAKVHAGWNDRSEYGTPVEDDYPVFNVRVDDAHEFARWLRGELPSPAQWDKAAGFFDRGSRQGPFRGRWDADPKPQVAVKQPTPLPVLGAGSVGLLATAAGPGALLAASAAVAADNRGVPLKAGQARDDVSAFGCHDMAGNGWEWTNQVVPGDRRVPLKRPRPEDAVRLRGRSYQADTPLLFAEMDEPGQPVFGACPYNASLPDLGFRVVIQPK